ncbi:MAG TPA: hypothetical protein PKH65_00585 [Bacteroidia bacterium]|nr:hypothetical protein [Bacteroidia bacterium]HNT79148.1 hypothetical protein [Bacteroidia bacterium]
MHVYRFKISFEDYEDVSREIEIKSDQTFYDLQQVILKSIGFDKEMSSSFYMSNDNWIKGTEITSETKTDKSGNSIALLKEAKLRNYISDPHQKIYYIFDLENRWIFYVELTKILSATEGETYPKCTRSIGQSPKQFASIENISKEDEEDLDEFLVDESSDENDNEIFDGVDEGETDEMETEGEEGEEVNEESDEQSEMEEEY